ncbi:aspartate dehydrogenase [Xenophilus sp. Marseille-Q4582]|uniref:aspartate dehydrogenase n=1 Tax=Xenophilus sp. Marseille-Q4582 TaxID=2866600 RepID=UPI002106321E|nr:aspartate dehydrogenase [Xenophilus sp. Marseille-Q4582]
MIGYGAIGQSLIQAWQAAPVRGHAVVGVLARSHQLPAARGELPHDVQVTADPETFLAHAFDVVVEVAGQPAVRELGSRVLRGGADLMIMSVGALADAAVADELLAAAQAGNARLVIPVGAIAGLDGLLALRRAGLTQLVYASSKPPASWRGTPADGAFELDALTEATVVFDGSAREAALKFPKNANLAATVALAGMGLDRTRVVLTADPHSTENVQSIEAVSDVSTLRVTVSGRSEGANPKSSAVTGLSVLSALDNQAQLLVFS